MKNISKVSKNDKNELYKKNENNKTTKMKATKFYYINLHIKSGKMNIYQDILLKNSMFNEMKIIINNSLEILKNHRKKKRKKKIKSINN